MAEGSGRLLGRTRWRERVECCQIVRHCRSTDGVSREGEDGGESKDKNRKRRRRRNQEEEARWEVPEVREGGERRPLDGCHGSGWRQWDPMENRARLVQADRRPIVSRGRSSAAPRAVQGQCEPRGDDDDDGGSWRMVDRWVVMVGERRGAREGVSKSRTRQRSATLLQTACIKSKPSRGNMGTKVRGSSIHG
ncbi:uncharacterized protein BKA78DRAFT_150956 [Phyllosticta capitalensis]|uniref:uncharacterized protein n=1 Tax=Phyllosticta capitalensis TaxID=121624 RepID=UPI003131B211